MKINRLVAGDRHSMAWHGSMGRGHTMPASLPLSRQGKNPFCSLWKNVETGRPHLAGVMENGKRKRRRLTSCPRSLCLSLWRKQGRIWSGAGEEQAGGMAGSGSGNGRHGQGHGTGQTSISSNISLSLSTGTALLKNGKTWRRQWAWGGWAGLPCMAWLRAGMRGAGGWAG